MRARLGTSLLQQLDDAIDFDDYRDYHAALRGLYFASLSPTEAEAEMSGARVFPWADPGLIGSLWNVRFAYDEVELGDDGLLHVSYWTNVAAFGMHTETVALDPFEMIAVRYLYPEPEAGAERHQTQYMPAINLRSLHRKQFKEELQTAVDVSLLAVGGAGLIGAGSRLARAVAALDLALGAADLAVREFRGQIGASEQGRDFLAAWDLVSTLIAVYGVARVVLELPATVDRLRRAWHRLRAGSGGQTPGRLDDQLDELFDAADDVEDAARKVDPEQAIAGAPETPLTAPSYQPDAGAAPSGKRTAIPPDDAPENIQALRRENESADILAKNGYRVEQNPKVLDSAKNPDYLVEGQVFDNYAPTNRNPRNIWSTIKGKVEAQQAKRIVLNLNDSAVDLSGLSKQFADWPIPGLEQVLVIRGNEVIRFWP